jgi:hypothetical protein
MLPLRAEKLSFREIADHWSRESRYSKDELLALLESAWWRGELKGNSALNRLQFLKKMFGSRHEPHLQSVVFVTPNDAGLPAQTPLPGGGVLVDVTPRITVSAETDDWTEDSCNDAFEELAGLPSQQFFPQLNYASFCYIELTSEEFFAWIRIRGFDVPTFWKMTELPSGREAAPNREVGGKEERKSTARPPLKRGIEAAYKQRIKIYRGKKPPSRIDDEKWAKEQFGLGVTKARDLRRNLAPPDWREPGRRKCKD